MNNPHRYNQYRLHKLKETSNKFPLVIGVDFDFTLVDPLDNYSLYQDIVEILHQAKSVGFILCIWTANPDKNLVLNKWLEAGISWDHYNMSPINPDNRKPHFNILLDDSAGLEQSLELLQRLIRYKEGHQ